MIRVLLSASFSLQLWPPSLFTGRPESWDRALRWVSNVRQLLQNALFSPLNNPVNGIFIYFLIYTYILYTWLDTPPVGYATGGIPRQWLFYFFPALEF